MRDSGFSGGWGVVNGGLEESASLNLTENSV